MVARWRLISSNKALYSSSLSETEAGLLVASPSVLSFERDSKLEAVCLYWAALV